MNWLKPWIAYPPPNPDDSPTTADFMLDSDGFREVYNAATNFVPSMGPQYANPKAYRNNMLKYAFSLTQNDFEDPPAPPDWDWFEAGMAAVDKVFAALKQVAFNPNAEQPISVWQSWTGELPETPAPQPESDPMHAATGQSAAPPGTIL